MTMNSREYWDSRFRDDWEALGGAAQSRFFASLAVDAMPGWFRDRLRNASMTVCDWGCAEGAGTETLAELLDVAVTGIDFSATAIALAKQRHPLGTYVAADVLAAPLSARFDVIFSSNTLEHFREPWTVFDTIAGMARRYVVLLLPYRELVRHPEHFVTFTPSDLPAARNGFVLAHLAVVNAATLPGSSWPGEQVLCVYARTAELEANGLSLSNLRFDTPALEALRAELDATSGLEQRLRDEVARQDASIGAVEQLTTAVLDMQARIVTAISDDITRTRQEHARVLEAATVLQAENTAQAALLADAQSQAQQLRAEVEARVHAEHALRAELEGRLRALESRLPKLELDSSDLARIRNSRAWRWSAPLRMLKRLATGRTSPGQAWRSLLATATRLPLGDGNRRRLLHAAHAVAFDAAPGTVQPIAPGVLRASPAAAGKPDVFVWAVIDWHFRIQRPQHLARAMAERGHRVFYVSNNCIDSHDPGFILEPLDRHGRLFQVRLHVKGTPTIYHGMPSEEQLGDLQRSLARLVAWAGTTSSISWVQHPFWSGLATMPPNVRRVYDCMDHHAGFEDNAGEMVAAERMLVEQSDLVVVTSSWLEQEIGPHAKRVAVIRNGCEHAFFSTAPRRIFRDPNGRKVIGYYGAIAEWFDADLVAAIAAAFPDALVLLVGADTAGTGDRLAGIPNVRFEGEVAYSELPYWLHGFDVCMLPFKVLELTLATNPVKVYEYLSAGKPVVSVDLPEMIQFNDLVRIATDEADFIDGVRDVLSRPCDPGAVASRQRFAAQQTWGHRAVAVDEAIASIPEPRTSVIVLAYNNLPLTEACLSSIALHSDYPDLEVIVVDNASTDGTREYLRTWVAGAAPTGQVRRVIANDSNLGFAAGNNVGLMAATGDYLVLLNNDTYVTPGWVRTLVSHLRRDPSLGLVGPTTNNIGNEAKLDIHYQDMQQMIALAGKHTRANVGREVAIPTVAFFCVAMSRNVLETVGGLDEAFGIGFFEDDDYCRRVEQAGLRVAFAEDVFVHHHLSASFAKMDSEEKRALFEGNRSTYEAKWGPWTPHAYRQDNS